jgi:hypothetical protein
MGSFEMWLMVSRPRCDDVVRERARYEFIDAFLKDRSCWIVLFTYTTYTHRQDTIFMTGE